MIMKRRDMDTSRGSVRTTSIPAVRLTHHLVIGRIGLILWMMVTAPVLGNTPPQPTDFETSLFIKEDTTVGTIIGNISAMDADGQPIFFDIDTPDTHALVELSGPVEVTTALFTWTADIILKAPLDRDFAPTERKLYFTISDGSSSIPTVITLFIMDVNDVKPQFVNLPYEVTIKEDTPSGTVIFSRVSAKDPDNGRGGTVSYSMESNAQGADAEYLTTFEINQYNGNITLKRSLNYEKHSYYQFLLMPEDGEGLKGDSASFVVYVLDVQDSPPGFVNLPYSIQIDEDTPVDSPIQQVRAVDGDSGIPNNITYSFESGDFDNFQIDDTTGIITIKNALDRDSSTMRNTGGVYAMIVKASEVIPLGQINKGKTSATTLVTITVKDVNDNVPTFNEQNYMATILENMQQDVPVAFQDGFMRVYDRDQGLNSHFFLTLQKDGQPYTDFAPLPQEIYSESSILIRVNNSAVLDYEKNQRIVFEVVARELDTVDKASSTATVTIDIEDMNDNAPVFSQADFSLDIMENLPVDKSIGQFEATDEDSGKFGEIKYSLRGGNGGFKINEDTGELRVTGNIDRETNEKYYMTVEAKDGGGLRTPVEVIVTILDDNDNKPIFRRSDYEGIVPEEKAQFVRTLQVEAMDDDQKDTANSQVSYRINNTPTGLESNFSIDATTGVITLTQPLDFEVLDPALNGRLALEVEAFDEGDPVQSSMVTVNVIVEDVNDFAPEFKEAEYVTTIPEKSEGGLVVYTVSAQDLDGTSPNNKFIYRIENGAFDKFRINFESGEVTVEKKAVLDRETRQEYTLMISAIDRGTPPQTGDCILKIRLSDINDEYPELDPVTATIQLMETAKPGEVVYTFNATDADLDNDLVYNLLDIEAYTDGLALDVAALGINTYFELDPDTGSVTVLNSPDRETAERIDITIEVVDLNAQGGDQSARGMVSIVLLDYNDNRPVFLPSDVYTVDVSETDGVNSIVLQVTATDPDEDQTVSYTIGQTTVDAFTINVDGTIRLSAKLDRETNENVEFEVIATDSGEPTMTSTATVKVLVLDANDNKPVFESHDKRISVSEDVEVGHLVTKLTATDKDKGDFGKVYYTLIGPDIEDGNFEINEDTGEIRVAKQLNREDKDRYRLEVEAFDSKDNPDESESTRSSPITFIILDVDDNAPIFTSVSPEYPSVSETYKKDLTIVAVTAEDKDDPTLDNGRIIYSLTSDTNATLDNGDPLFKINPQTGIVKSAVDLDGNPGIYFITVKATNEAGKYEAVERIMVEVLDVNVAVPKFIDPSKDNQEVKIAENLDIGTFVFQVIAEDDDSGTNGKILYSLLPVASLDGSKVFNIHPDTGRITTKDVLNAEVQEMYEIRIQIRDQGFPIPYSTSRTIIIKVTDQNDHKPKFPNIYKSPYGIELPEGSANNCTSINFAKDEDRTKLPMCYYLIGSELMGSISIKENDLCTDIALDRETTPFINAVILVDENCDKPDVITEKITMEPNTLPLMFQQNEKNKLWLKIKVTDINDNKPKFKRRDLAVGVTRVTQFGTFIYDLKNDVVDEDTPEFGVDYFVATSEFTAHPDALKKELEELKVVRPFTVFKNGDIQTQMYFKPQMSGFFTVDLKVVDKGGLEDTARLRISLINDDQRLKIVFRARIDTIGPLKGEIASRLGQKIGYRIVVDSIQTHETAEGKADLAKTDMFIHGEDLQTNEVIPAARLLNVMDQKNNLLIEILNDYNVLEIVEVQELNEDDSFEDKLKMALILVSVVLGPICIILAIVLYILVRRYQRKLKVATAIAYVNSGVEPHNSELHKSDIPGTNLHSYENPNPIFLEKVMLESLDGRNSIDENVFVTESTFDDHEMVLDFNHVMEEGGGSSSNKRKSESSLSSIQRQSRPESYLKAVLDHQSSQDGSTDRHKNKTDNDSFYTPGFDVHCGDVDNDDGGIGGEASDNSCGSSSSRNYPMVNGDHDEDILSSSKVGGLSCTESVVEVEDDHHQSSLSFGAAMSSVASSSSSSPSPTGTGKANVSAFNQVISELKDDRGRHLKKTPLGRTESGDSQASAFGSSSPFVTVLNVNADVETNGNRNLDDVEPYNIGSKTRNNDNNNNSNNGSKNPFLSNTESDNNDSVRKRNESLNSPFKVTPAYSDFRNGLRPRGSNPDSMELTDL